MKRATVWISCLVTVPNLILAPVMAQPPAVPNLVQYSGTLAEFAGRPVVGVTFALYKVEQGGAPIWMETQNVSPDPGGRYTVLLGAAKNQGLPMELFASGEARWLGVQPEGRPEQPRVVLLSVPYALKAADAETIGGLPPSAFMLAPWAASGASAAASPAVAAPAVEAPALAGSGTLDFVPLWTPDGNTLGNSILFQSASSQIGVGTTTPAATLDIAGSAKVRGTLLLPAIGAATASRGNNSQPLNMAASGFNSGTAAAVNQTFRWQAEPAGNNTTAPSATLNLLFGAGTSTPTETGLNIGSTGLVKFAAGQTFPGTGTITGVTAGTDLKGGGTSGNVTLNVDTTKVPQLSGNNIFTGNQTINGSETVNGSVNGVSSSTAAYAAAVMGEAAGSSGQTIGVKGFTLSPLGMGVLGTGSGLSSTGQFDAGVVGVWGDTNSSGASGAGLVGTADGALALRLMNNSIVNGTAFVENLESSTHGWFVALFVGSFGNCAFDTDGNLFCTGSKSAVAPVDNGQRQVALYAVEAPQNWFEDFGSGQLANGVAAIALEPTYAQTVNTAVDYHVFLTPQGDCRGLYVSRKTAAGFEVHELGGGTSNVAFDFRVVALRRGYEAVRLADKTEMMAHVKSAGPHAGGGK